jgi:hypothetical protein
MKHIQNNQKYIGKPIPAYDFKNLQKNLLPNVFDF